MADVLPIPSYDAISSPDGKPTTSAYRFWQSLQGAASSALASVAAINARTEGDTFASKTPANGDENVLINAPYGFKIASITSKCTTGTITATFKIGGVALGGGANSVSTTEQTITHTSANTVAISDDLTVTYSANAACLGAIFTIAYTRT